MISVHGQRGQVDKAMDVFEGMQQRGVKPNETTWYLYFISL